MEKLSLIKSKFLKFLPKKLVASSVAFKTPVVSPARSPTRMISIIPKEARRKHKDGISFSSANEPASPKVTCMGQVKKKKKKKNKNKAHNIRIVQQHPMNKSDFMISYPENKENCEGSPKEKKPSTTVVAASSLGTMKRFSSGRGSLCDFDATLTESMLLELNASPGY